VGVGEGAALNSGEGVAQRHRHLAGFAVPDGEFGVAIFHMRDRRNDRGGATGEDLGDLTGGGLLLPLVDVDLAFLDGEPRVGCQLQQ